jgi:hypothetical protein
LLFSCSAFWTNCSNVPVFIDCAGGSDWSANYVTR